MYLSFGRAIDGPGHFQEWAQRAEELNLPIPKDWSTHETCCIFFSSGSHNLSAAAIVSVVIASLIFITLVLVLILTKYDWLDCRRNRSRRRNGQHYQLALDNNNTRFCYLNEDKDKDKDAQDKEVITYRSTYYLPSHYVPTTTTAKTDNNTPSSVYVTPPESPTSEQARSYPKYYY